MTQTTQDPTPTHADARLSMFIDGRWVESDERRELRSPATGQVTGSVAEGGVEHVDLAVAAAKRAHESGVWSSRTPEQRADLLDRVADALEARHDELCAMVAVENGATVRQAAAFHVGVALGSLRHFAASARSYAFERPLEPTTSPLPAQGYIRREPVGVVGAILPFNFPLVLGVWKIGPALAAGNTIVVKPDEGTPTTLLLLAEVAHEAGLPAGVLNVVTGDGEVLGPRLVEHPDVRKIAFTGSTEVGREVMRGAASTIKRVTLELGGKGPSVILDDADLDLAVPGSLFAFLMYNGQVCESGTRVLVPRGLQDEVVRRMAARLDTLRIGDPLDPATDFGPVIDRGAVERVERMVEEALAAGASLAYRGTVPDHLAAGDGHWVAPVVLADVTNDMEIARTEVFGPVGVLIAYDTVDEAVAIANDTEYGLAAGVWGGDEDRAMDVARRLEAGTVWVNDWHMFPLVGPFGGYKQSGLGRELGADAIDEYTEVKYIHRAADQDPQARAYALVFGH